ncbi:MAG: site-specific integrase [Methanobacteriota archaeon]|nr:MAG: site-specific integrase [Euryarchaeota archaeon]
MGRYPFMTWVNRYMDANGQYLAETTRTVRRSMLSGVARDYASVLDEARQNDALRGVPCHLSANPKNWTIAEPAALMAYWADKGVAHQTQRQRISVLGKLLGYIGNPALSQLKARQPHTFPTGRSERKDALSAKEVSRILLASKRISGYSGACAEFFFAMCAYTGARRSEIRRAQIDDLDTHKWEFTVRHPKGEHRYGRKRVLPVPEPLRPIVIGFLDERQAMLDRNGVGTVVQPLIPSAVQPANPISNTAVETWVQQTKALTASDGEGAALPFGPHALRRTYGQMLLDGGASVESVSIMLGHDSTRTTETYYCRKADSDARREVNETFADMSEPVTGIPEDMTTKRRELSSEPDTRVSYHS